MQESGAKLRHVAVLCDGIAGSSRHLIPACQQHSNPQVVGMTNQVIRHAGLDFVPPARSCGDRDIGNHELRRSRVVHTCRIQPGLSLDQVALPQFVHDADQVAAGVNV